jgi:hypothetical protein
VVLGCVAAVAASLIGRDALACAGCSNPNLPTARAGNESLGPGQVSVALNLSGTTMRVVHSESCPDIGPICAQRDEPPQLHDQRFYVAELRPVIGVGITDVFGAELHTPLRLVNTSITFRRLDGTAFEPDYENIHHRDETLFGLADPWLLARGSWSVDALTIVGRAGTGLPLGSTQEDPFARGRAGLPHQHIQFGTGTFYPVLAVDAVYPFGKATLSGYAQTLLFLYENSHGYRAGNRYMGGVAGDVELIEKLRIGASADVLNEQPEQWNGVVQQDGNVGRTDVLAGGSLSYRFGKVTALLTVKVPVYQHFIEGDHAHQSDPGQLTYPAIVNLAAHTRFGGPEG